MFVKQKQDVYWHCARARPPPPSSAGGARFDDGRGAPRTHRSIEGLPRCACAGVGGAGGSGAAAVALAMVGVPQADMAVGICPCRPPALRST
eukprot:402680-Alexandrium_andersonii.AAC.1